MWRHWKGHLQGSIESLIGPHSPEPSQIPIRPNFGRCTLHSPQKSAQPLKIREDTILKAVRGGEDKSILKRGEYFLEYLHHLPPINREEPPLIWHTTHTRLISNLELHLSLIHVVVVFLWIGHKGCVVRGVPKFQWNLINPYSYWAPSLSLGSALSKSMLAFLNVVTKARQRTYPQQLRQKCPYWFLLRSIARV